VSGLSSEKKSRSVLRAEEPLVSYEQVLLSQINYCAKVSKEQYPLCIDNLVSLLPIDLRAVVINEYDQIMKLLNDYIRKEKPECCEINDVIKCTCCGIESFEIGNRILLMFKEEHPDLYLKHKHVLRRLIPEILNIRGIDVSRSALMFSIMLNLLLELKIIGPKSITPHIGRVKG
jgi:hypothetical protein